MNYEKIHITLNKMNHNNNKPTRKAQVKFGETIAILFIFFILLILGFIFYGRFSAVSASQDVIEQQEIQSVGVSQAITYLSELSCTERNVLEEGCFDLHKVIALNTLGVSQDADPQLRAYYLNLFGSATITITSVFPKGETYVLYNNSKEEFSQGLSSFFPISLKNASDNSYSLAVLSVVIYT